MTGIATIHYTLRDVNAPTRHVGIRIDVSSAKNRPSMDTHAQLKLGLVAQCLSHLQRAQYRRLWIAEEHQCHAVPRRETDEFIASGRLAELRCVLNKILERLDYRLLTIHPHG